MESLGSLLVPDKDQSGNRGGTVGGHRREKAHVGPPSAINGSIFERGEPILN